MEPLFTETFLDTAKQAIVCKGLDGCIQQCTNHFAKLVGFKHWKDSLGVSIHHFPHETIAKQAAVITRQEQTALSSGNTVYVLDLHTYHNNQRIASLTTITPWHDKQGEVCGTYTQSTELSPRLFSVLQKSLLDNHAKLDLDNSELSLSISDSFDNLGLSKREAECLYYLLRGQSSSSIGKRLGIAGGTVEVYVANVKSKLRCKKKSDLIEHCVEHGYTSFIPSTLLPKDISEITAA